MKVGFIGLGTMGASIALNAIKGQNSLVVHDINREAANPHLEIGAEWASSPKEVAAQSDVVFTSLPGPNEVEAVALGEDGLMAGFATGSAFLTSAPIHRPLCADCTQPCRRRALKYWTRRSVADRTAQRVEKWQSG